MSKDLFHNSLSQLAQERGVIDQSVKPCQQTEGEMMKLARGILPGFVDDSLLSVTCSARDGYQVQGPSSDVTDIKAACRALAVTSGYLVSFHTSDGQVEHFRPPPVPVRLPGDLPQLGLRRWLVREMIENLVVPERPHGSGPVKVKPPKQPSKSITPSSSTTAGPTVSTGATLKGSLADLGNERFYADLLGGKAVGGRDLVISCEFEDVRALIDQKISDRFPMRFTQTASRSASLTVDERYSGERDDLERYVRAIQAVTVWNIELQFRDLLPEIEVKPDALTGEPTLRVASDGLPLLPMCVQERQPDSNIVECHAEFPLTTRRMLELVTAQINTGRWFVSLQGGSGSVNYGAKKFSELILRMGEELNFGGLECVPGPASITVNLECSPGLVDCEQIPLMVDLIEALSPLCSKRVVLNRIFKDEDIAQFCSQKFGDDFDWNIERRDSSVILTTSSPERVSKERVELFSKVFGLQFKFAPPPESLGAEEPVLVSGGAEELMLQHELAALLPPAVGRFAQFHMDGDRLTIFARTKNLPKAYIEKIVQDLVSIKCNSIEVSEDPHACGVKDPSLLSDIIVRTLPSDVYLRGVKRVEGKFVITLSNRSQGASITDNYKADLQACCDLPLEFNTQEFSPVLLKRFLDRPTDEPSRRVLAQVVTDGDELIGQGAFWEVLKEVFGVERPALKGVVPTASRSLAPVRDLTHLNCFSVDSAGARLKEDVFSVEPDVDKGGWTIGVHIANAARYVELGSTLDILARRLGKFDRVVSGGDRNLLFMLPLKILEAIDLGVNQPRETFSLLFSIDENLRIREGSQWLGLATVTNRNSYSRKQLDFNLAGRAPLPHFQLLERFARTDSTLFWTKEVDAPFVPAEAIVGGMVDIFNSYAARLLGEKGIALPRHHNRDSVELPYRFTGGGRIYTSLMAQRQLLAHLEDREPHSEQQVAAIVREIGVTLSESVAYRLFEYASGIWKDDVNAHVKLCSTGGVIKRRR